MRQKNKWFRRTPYRRASRVVRETVSLLIWLGAVALGLSFALMFANMA